MTIREKIKLYCTENSISVAEFARTVDEKPQNFNEMLSGRNRLNSDTLKKMRKAHPKIDLNKLFDDEKEDYFLVAEERAEYGEDEFRKRLAKDAEKVIQLMERYK